MGTIPPISSIPDTLPRKLGERIWPDAHLVRVKRGHSVISSGRGSSDVFFLLTGRVQVVLLSPTGKDVIVRDIAAGSMFGEYAALDGGARSATVVAMTDCVCAKVASKIFREALDHTPGAALWLSQHFIAQIRALTEKMFELSALAVRNRLHCELLRMCEAAGVNGQSATIDPVPTHSDLASRIGSHREAVTREMRYLSEHGVLEQQGRRLVVQDVGSLMSMVRDAAGETDTLRAIGEFVSLPLEAGLVAALR